MQKIANAKKNHGLKKIILVKNVQSHKNSTPSILMVLKA
jgi:hypothetical protein